VNYHLVNLFDSTDAIPDFNFNCKFSLIKGPAEIYLIFGPLKVYRYHAQLIYKFCSIYDLACSWIKKLDLVEMHENEFKIKGGGIMTLDSTRKVIEFKGGSTSYGKFDQSLVKEFAQNNQQFNGFSVFFGT
jgi:hypothetical protein